MGAFDLHPLTVYAPPVDADQYRDRVKQRLEELWIDLGLPGRPAPTWRTGLTAAARVGGEHLLTPPRQPPANPGWPRWETEAEAVVAGLLAARWQLLRPSLLDAGVRWVDELESCAQCGLGFSALSRLAREASCPEDLPWMAADLCPPALSLVVAEADAVDRTDLVGCPAVQAALSGAARWLGIPLPEPALEVDESLRGGRLRVRIGDVRGAALPAPPANAVEPSAPGHSSEDAPNDEWPQSALFHHLRAEAWRLLDVGAVLQLLLADDRVPPSLAGELLTESDALAYARALRGLLRDGFGIVDGASLCEDLMVSGVERVRPAASASPRRNVVLPGAGRPHVPNAVDPLAARLRAAAVPRHLLHTAWREDDRLGHDVWTLDAGVVDRLRAATSPSGDILSMDELEICAWHLGLLLVPSDLREPVRELTQDALPQLRVVGFDEIPRPLAPRRRGRISLRKDPL